MAEPLALVAISWIVNGTAITLGIAFIILTASGQMELFHFAGAIAGMNSGFLRRMTASQQLKLISAMLRQRDRGVWKEQMMPATLLFLKMAT